MISLPIFHSLDVDGYGMYPGNQDDERVHIEFRPGLTLILGANGLGKSTLILMLYRLLTGPYDIPALANRAQLGNASIEATAVPGRTQRQLAERVADRAREATASLSFSLGGQNITVTRRLSNLSLAALSVDTRPVQLDEIQYQAQIMASANVPRFGDWILILQYLIFYFERRRSLVWDPSAQRQLLRIMLLDAEIGDTWAGHERRILELDTQMRNLRAVTTSEERALEHEKLLGVDEAQIRDELRQIYARREQWQTELDTGVQSLAELDTTYEEARHRAFTAAHEREARYRALERAQLLQLSSHFPSIPDSVAYIYSQLVVGMNCLVCGNHVPDHARSLQQRLNNNVCVVCESAVDFDIAAPMSDDSGQNISELASMLDRAEVQLEGAQSALDAADRERRVAIESVEALRISIHDAEQRIPVLSNRLPQASEEMEERRLELRRLQARADALEIELGRLRREFAGVIAEANAIVVERASEILDAFGQYARRFLLEDCELTWAPSPARLGQTGQRFDFPAFGLDLGGSDFASAVRRTGPDEVSESQREFIDLAFRMALCHVSSTDRVSSLIVDAPESSLDAVFVDRAASVLGDFGKADRGNRLIVASNLIAGDLVPQLLNQALPNANYSEHIVDLLSVAAPTSAVRELEDEYKAVLSRVLQRAQELSGG